MAYSTTPIKKSSKLTEERKKLLKKFIEIFGIENIKSLTANREFIGETWFKWLK